MGVKDGLERVRVEGGGGLRGSVRGKGLGAIVMESRWVYEAVMVPDVV